MTSIFHPLLFFPKCSESMPRPSASTIQVTIMNGKDPGIWTVTAFPHIGGELDHSRSSWNLNWPIVTGSSLTSCTSTGPQTIACGNNAYSIYLKYLHVITLN